MFNVIPSQVTLYGVTSVHGNDFSQSDSKKQIICKVAKLNGENVQGHKGQTLTPLIITLYKCDRPQQEAHHSQILTTATSMVSQQNPLVQATYIECQHIPNTNRHM